MTHPGDEPAHRRISGGAEAVVLGLLQLASTPGEADCELLVRRLEGEQTQLLRFGRGSGRDVVGGGCWPRFGDDDAWPRRGLRLDAPQALLETVQQRGPGRYAVRR